MCKIRLLAYCVLDNHYHLVLENNTGCMSQMMREVNGQYASVFRKKEPGRGTIYQDRFKSTLIENDAYLITSMTYALYNPVRAGMVERYGKYRWSSAGELLDKHNEELTDREFVFNLFGDREGFLRQMDAHQPQKRLETKRSRFGEIFGGEGFDMCIEKCLNRQRKPGMVRGKHCDDYVFEPLSKVLQEFEVAKKINLDDLDPKTITGKRRRGELLVNIRERCGLKYSEILELPYFSDIQLGSMGSLYWHSKNRSKGQ